MSSAFLQWALFRPVVAGFTSAETYPDELRELRIQPPLLLMIAAVTDQPVALHCAAL